MSSTFKKRGSKFARPSRVTSVRRTPVAECKVVDYNGNFPCDNTASNIGLALVNGMSAGTGRFQRVGRRATMASINLQYNLDPFNVTSGSDGDRLKVALVYDKFPSGALPLYSDVFASVDNTGTQTSDVESPANLTNTHRFKILHNRYFNVGGWVAGGNPDRLTTNAEALQMRRYIKCKLPVQWSGDTATIGSLSGGSLLLLFQSTVTTQASQQWVIHYNIRVCMDD